MVTVSVTIMKVTLMMTKLIVMKIVVYIYIVYYFISFPFPCPPPFLGQQLHRVQFYILCYLSPPPHPAPKTWPMKALYTHGITKGGHSKIVNYLGVLGP